MTSSLRAEATNPAQYEQMNVDWQAEGDFDSPVRAWIREYLEPVIQDKPYDTVLDVGCGTGWLSRVVSRSPYYTGIDPAGQNIQIARHLYPMRQFIQSSFEQFPADETYDLSTCVMATEHIDDLAAAFQKWQRLVKAGGRLVIIAGDKTAFSSPRFDYDVAVEHASEDETVVRTVRPRYPTTTDIVRTPDRFQQLAANADFALLDHQVMTATDSLVAARPEYERYRTEPLFHLLEFAQ